MQEYNSSLTPQSATPIQPLTQPLTQHSQHWGDVNTIIGKWLIERQELIRILCSLTEEELSQAEFAQRLESFCEVLVDYLSAGHFEVFSELENEARTFDARGIQLVNALYPYLEQSTEVALWFNDRCDQLRNSSTKYEQIRSELSYLGESLTDRFELEDQMIEYVHRSNAVEAN